jgi:hypothetical protein
MEDLRSVWFYSSFYIVTAIYRADFVDGDYINLTSIEKSKTERIEKGLKNYVRYE